MTIALGNRRELLLDTYLIAELQAPAALTLHQPTIQNVAITADAPWEGCMNTFNTVLKDGDTYRLYYRGWQVDVDRTEKEKSAAGLNTSRPACICLAESTDGITWHRRTTGHLDYQGSTDNNIVLLGEGWHGFSPFIDTNPDALPEERYKAVGVGNGWPLAGLFAFTSPDGIHWTRKQDTPIFTEGKFDSHNLIFWDPHIGQYRAYVRDMITGPDGPDGRKYRCIRTATSPDFYTWTESPQFLDYQDSLPTELYTNNVLPYYRAPHLLIGLPARYVERPWTPSMEQLPELKHRRMRSALSERYGTATSDAVFMSSRDGLSFKRWDEAFIRPGPRATDSWTYGDIYPAWGMIETPAAVAGSAPEISLFASEGYWRGEASAVRRYTLRVDGFVSVRAPLAGGSFTTHPLTFTGNRLSLNIATSAAGHARIALLTADGQPIEGYTADDCWHIIGDTHDYTVRWGDTTDLTPFIGQPIRLHVQLHDADLYALQFAD